MGVLALTVAVFSTPFIKFLLNESNVEVLKIGRTFLTTIGLSEPLYAVTIDLSITTQGAGDT